MEKKIFLFDTTLRDGSQSEAIHFTLEDKLSVYSLLDDFGLDYIEGGWPGSNPKDMEFFARVVKRPRQKAKLTAFGSTRRANLKAEEDLNLLQIVQTHADCACIFGKTWDFQVEKALNISLDQNLAMISDSVRFLKQNLPEVVFDLEHFFDGYKGNPTYAKQVIQAAVEGGADFIVFCDTNGGTLPWEIAEIIAQVKTQIPVPIGIHAHNDSEVAVSNSLFAVRAGCTMVQGTVNGLGERCGNANLLSIIANLQLKMQIPLLGVRELSKLTRLSNMVAEIANVSENFNQPYVGRSAFAHKAGVHVSAITKNPQTYEHIPPETVGNQRRVLVSELSGSSNLIFKLQALQMENFSEQTNFKSALAKIKALEFQGYTFEGADASFELFIKRECGQMHEFFQLKGYRIIDEKRIADADPISEATVKLHIPGQSIELAVAEGHGPVDALSNALKKGLSMAYPELKKLALVDYKVRILDSKSGTAARTRVLITSHFETMNWTTVGLSYDVINASLESLCDSINYLLMKTSAQNTHERVPSVV